MKLISPISADPSLTSEHSTGQPPEENTLYLKEQEVKSALSQPAPSCQRYTTDQLTPSEHQYKAGASRPRLLHSQRDWVSRIAGSHVTQHRQFHCSSSVQSHFSLRGKSRFTSLYFMSSVQKQRRKQNAGTRVIWVGSKGLIFH